MVIRHSPSDSYNVAAEPAVFWIVVAQLLSNYELAELSSTVTAFAVIASVAELANNAPRLSR
jgi:hypothetical protein